MEGAEVAANADYRGVEQSTLKDACPMQMHLTSASPLQMHPASIPIDWRAKDAMSRMEMLHEGVGFVPPVNAPTMPVAAAADPESIRFAAEHHLQHMPPLKTRRGLDKNWHPKYVCQENGCNKTFTTSAHLSRHIKLHIGIKPHRCPIADCGKGFARRDNMMVHYRAHTRKLGLTAANKDPALPRYRHPTAAALRGRQPTYHPPPEHGYGTYYHEAYNYYQYEGAGNYAYSPRSARNVMNYPGPHEVYEMHGPSAYTPRAAISYAQRMHMMEQWHQMGGPQQGGMPPASMLPDQLTPHPHQHHPHGAQTVPHQLNQTQQVVTKLEHQQQSPMEQPLESYSLPITTSQPFSYHSLIATPQSQLQHHGNEDNEYMSPPVVTASLGRWDSSPASVMDPYQHVPDVTVGIPVETPEVPFVTGPPPVTSTTAPATESPTSVEHVTPSELVSEHVTPSALVSEHVTPSALVSETPTVDDGVEATGPGTERTISESVTPPSPASQLQQAYTTYPEGPMGVQDEGSDGDVGALSVAEVETELGHF